MRTKRIGNIEKYIYVNKTVTLDQLCEEFKVSKNTIRRDIDELASKGLVKKIYGGVTIPDTQSMKPFEERSISNFGLKQYIAKKAASLINDGEIIFIDSGTTTFPMVEYIQKKNNLTILTNNIEVIIKCIPHHNINVISLSGILDRKALSFTGATAVDVLQQYNISKAFLAATGISSKNGATNSSPAETAIKRTAIERSVRKYLLVDHTKFEVSSLVTYAQFDKLDAIITDQYPGKELENAILSAGCEIILADS